MLIEEQKQKEQKKNILKPLKVDERKVIDIPSFPYGSLNRVGTIGEGSCFFHSLLYTIDPKYRTLSQDDREELVVLLRQILSESISRKKWRELGNGQLALHLYSQKLNEKGYNAEGKSIEELQDKLMSGANGVEKDELDDILEDTFQEFVENMKDCEVWVGYSDSDVNLFEYLSDLFNVNIFIIQDQSRSVYKMGSVYDASKDSIIILWVDKTHYEAIVDENGNGIFKSGGEVSKELFKM